MAENKMEQVAAMFGKELNETFHVKYSDRYIARFSKYGFECFNTHGLWYKEGQVLNALLTGKAVIVDES